MFNTILDFSLVYLSCSISLINSDNECKVELNCSEFWPSNHGPNHTSGASQYNCQNGTECIDAPKRRSFF